jgi:hypothetical protein
MFILRRFAVLALLFGVFAGFGSAFRSHFRHRHDLYERHFAALCADAAHHPGATPPDPSL